MASDDLRTRIAEIRAREQAATPGPWRVENNQTDLNRWVSSDDQTLDINFGYLGNRTQNDAAFVAHSREDVPWLLAGLDRLTAERDAARRELDDARSELYQLRTRPAIGAGTPLVCSDERHAAKVTALQTELDKARSELHRHATCAACGHERHRHGYEPIIRRDWCSDCPTSNDLHTFQPKETQS